MTLGPFRNYSEARAAIRTALDDPSAEVIQGVDSHNIWTRSAIQELIPWTDVLVHDGSRWEWDRRKKKWSEHRPVEKRHDVLLFIPFATRVDLLRKALMSADGPADKIVIDSTGTFDDPDVGIYRTPIGTTFTSQQNAAQQIAASLGYELLIFMHADACCLRPQTLTDFIAWSRRAIASGAGVCFSWYDTVAVFSMAAIKDVGVWDETWEWYTSDADYYYRMRLRGWTTVDWPFGPSQISHVGSASIKSDPALAAAANASRSWQEGHYLHKWGGRVGTDGKNGTERHVIPYGEYGQP